METFIGGLFALFIAAAGGSISYVLRLDDRLDKTEVKLAGEYATRKELQIITDKLDHIIIELSHKDNK